MRIDTVGFTVCTDRLHCTVMSVTGLTCAVYTFTVCRDRLDCTVSCVAGYIVRTLCLYSDSQCVETDSVVCGCECVIL